MTHGTYVELFELFMYDEIMQVIQEMEDKCSELVQVQEQPEIHDACTILAKTCNEIETLNI